MMMMMSSAVLIHQRDKQTDKPVGFNGTIAPPGPNAPSSRICDQNPRNDADERNISGSAQLCRQLPQHAATPAVLPLHATIGGRLPEWQTQNVSPPSVLFESSRIFLQDTGQTQK